MTLTEVRSEAVFEHDADAEALIREARRRQRRRWLVIACVVALLAAVVSTLLASRPGATAHVPKTDASLASAASATQGSGHETPLFEYPLGLDDLPDISCPSSSVCEAVGPTVGGSVALRTTNGGKSWATTALPISASEGEGGIACPSVSVCFVVGSISNGVSPGAAARTTNGGASWSLEKIAPRGMNLDEIACASSSDCQAAGGDDGGGVVAYRTTNGGASWTAETLPKMPGYVDGLTCPSVSTCYAVFQLNHGVGSPLFLAFSTTDFGVSWDSRFVGSDASGVDQMNDISCPTVTTCVMAGDVRLREPVRATYGITFTTTNGGRSWTRQPIPTFPGQIEAIDCRSASRCEMVGYSGLSHGGAALGTTDGGRHWTTTSFPAPVGELFGLACPTESRCLAGGAEQRGSVPVLFGTSNWGRTWTRQGLPGGVDEPLDISCASMTTCVLISDSRTSAHGVAISTTNSWDTWTVSSPPRYLANLTSLDCPSVSLCYVVGQTVGAGVNLVALHLTSRHTGWAREHLGSGRGAIKAVDCSSQSTCMALGETQLGHRLIAFRTVNGGMTWRAVDFPTRSMIPAAVACPAALTCVVAGVPHGGSASLARPQPPDLVLRTTDGGRSWDVYHLSGGLSAVEGLACTSTTVCDLLGLRLDLSKRCEESLAPSPPSPGIPLTNAVCYVGVAFRTVDGGAKWLNVKLPAGVGELDGIACASASSCAAFGRSPARGPTCVAYSNGYACSWQHGDPIVAITADSGASWSRETLPPTVREIDGLTCPMTSLCEMVGYTGTAVQVLQAK